MTDMERKECQMHCLGQMSGHVSMPSALWQFRFRMKRMLTRRYRYIVNYLSEILNSENSKEKTAPLTVKKQKLGFGDMVRVRTKGEIQSTLNRWNQLKGCAYMVEMFEYCGTTQRVMKKVGRFLDERDYLVKKCRGIVILEGVFCEGTKDFGACDRTCFYFWREEWLEKIG